MRLTVATWTMAAGLAAASLLHGCSNDGDQGTVQTCGNGQVEGSEFCDDGGTDPCGPCNDDCTAEGTGSVCGDGALCPDSEFCDDGGTDPCGACNDDCTAEGIDPVCGDGVVCPDTEFCDDGGTDPCGPCNTDCTAAGTGSVCGDGTLCPDSEFCDDGGTDPCGACNTDCTAEGIDPVCGDGVVCPDIEFCDDGGTDPCGPCNADCTTAGTGSVCGDGIICPDTEFCDDGGTDPCGACNDDCTAEGIDPVCGDGALCPDSEVCDDGGTDPCGPCNADCTAAGTGSVCGDGSVCPDTEFCDDGGTDPCGPCNADCTAEGIDPVCGDGALCPDAEFCDDGQTTACGPCNADCTAAGTGSVCGDGILCPDTEFCDDGQTTACGPCSADCTAAGTGSVCGDGVVCPDTEFCDDGEATSCGPCNADCTAAGTGSICGDGALCPDTEACDDGGTDACFACNADCTGPGNGTTCGSHLWSNRFGDTATQTGESIATDRSGNVLVTGYFYSTVDFGGGPLTSAGSWDIFVAKFDGSGNHLWSRRFGDTDSQFGDAIATDRPGNVFVTGHFLGTVDFGGGPLTSAGGSDIFVAKFDGSGNHLWSRRFGDASSQFPNAIAAKPGSGNVLVTGAFEGTVDFGGGPLTSAGSNDIFMAELNTSLGSHIRSRRFGDANNQVGQDIAADSSDNILVTGYFDGTVNFGGGLLTSAGNSDIFVAKFSGSGNHLWSMRFGDSNVQQSFAIATDASGNALITGESAGTVDFGGGPLICAGYDIFVAKFNGSGNHLWSKRFGDSNTQIGRSIATDSSGNVIVTGDFYGTMDFGGDPLASAGGTDIFVTKLDGSGSRLWSRRFGDANDQHSYDIATDTSDNAFITGELYGTVDFGGGPLTSLGWDIFIAKLGP